MKENMYDITVVIPVYNTEKYLSECLESVIKGQYDLSKIEIIAINDGSVDKSINILRDYEKKYDNIKVIDKKNAGVSAARNDGINIAKGKYIMLLDSDDSISKNAISNLVKFFDANYDDVDIVTYPIYFNRDGRISKSPRYKQFDKGTGIYDVDEYIYLNQCTVNIVIKNDGNKINAYNEAMKLSEDQYFNTEHIMLKRKLGFVSNAIYYYRKHAESVSQSRNNPYYCFNDIMGYNEMLLEKYSVDGKIPKYIQSLVINTLKWRIRTDELFPYYLENDEFVTAKKRVSDIIRKIDTDVVMDVPGMDFYHKIYFLKLSGRKLEVKFGDDINGIYCEGELIHEFETLDGYVARIKQKDGKIFFMGDVLNPIFEEIEPEIYIEKKYKNGETKTERLGVKISNESYHISKIMTNKAYGFDISFDIKDLKSFKTYAKVYDKKINIKYNFKKFAPRNFLSKKYNVFYSRKTDTFIIRIKNIITVLKSKLRNYRRIFKICPKALIYRFISEFYIKKNFWLYQDKSGVQDNGYYQFKHDFKKDNIKRYYVYNEPIKNLKNKFTEEEQKYLVKYKSLKHKMMFLKADKIISSFVDLQVYCPFNKGVSYYNDIFHFDLIYLQHGILFANLTKMYSKEFTQIDKFVISTTFERSNLTNKYHYKEEDLIECGMPRYDYDNMDVEAENKIIYAPSWRANLVGNLVNGLRKMNDLEFINSDMYKQINAFLNSEELLKVLKENKLVLDFKMHPNFKGYEKHFNIQNDNVKISFGGVELGKYKLFITDFSSYQFDFVRFKRPIIYFVPDMKMFKAGLHSYRELDLKYKDAFGPLTLNSEELLKEIKKVVDNNFKCAEIYNKRMDELFINSDKQQRDRLYDALV